MVGKNLGKIWKILPKSRDSKGSFRKIVRKFWIKYKKIKKKKEINETDSVVE